MTLFIILEHIWLINMQWSIWTTLKGLIFVYHPFLSDENKDLKCLGYFISERIFGNNVLKLAQVQEGLSFKVI